MASGAAYNLYGQENGNMGVDCGDYDNDGWLDLFVTDLSNRARDAAEKPWPRVCSTT